MENFSDKALVDKIKLLKEANEKLKIELESLKKEHKVIDNYFDLFDNIGIALAEFNVDDLRKENKRLKENNINIEEYFSNENNLIKHAALLKLKRINNEAKKLFEVENTEKFKLDISKVATNKSMKGIKERQLAFFNEDKFFTGENTYQTLEGHKINVLETIYFPSESSNTAIITLENITKNKNLENELKSNKENYRFLFDNSPVMIIEYDLSSVFKYYLSLNLKNTSEFKQLLLDRSTGLLEEAFGHLIIKDVNNTCVKLLKAPNKKDIIEHFGNYYTDKTFDDYIENVVLVFDGLLKRQFETELKTSQGELIDVLITWQVVPEYEKSFSKIFLILVDITRRKELDRQLRDMQKLDSMGLLAGGIAHDLNNLLTPILGSINLLESNNAINEDVQNHLKRLEETTLRATELVKQLLTYSGKGKFIIKSCNLNEILTKAKFLIELTATRKIEIIYDLDQNLPLIQADETQIQQVVINLVSNSAVAMNYSGKLIIETKTGYISDVELEQSFKRFPLKQGEYVILKITDEGMGITEDIKDKIFDPFFTTRKSGRGLGLSVVLGIVTTHKGGIRFDSEIGRGTIFTVIFPKGEAKTEDEIPQEIKTEEKEFNKFKRVLVCDDDESVREITALMLKQLGLEVMQAETGEKCLEIVHQEKVDILFTDLTMPNMDGITVVKEVRKISNTIPIILMSGYNEHEMEIQVSGLKLSGFLQKPFTIDTIKDKLNDIT